jgi:molecular chaperone IbpA
MVKAYNTIMDVFNDPFLIGFSREFDRLNTLKKTNSSISYPPYNVIKYTEDEYALSLAVAGFSRDDLSVVVDDGYLIVSGEIEEGPAIEPEYLYKGIANRKFTRKFALSEYMDVERTSLHNGLLHVYLKREVPEEKKPKQISIN